MLVLGATSLIGRFVLPRAVGRGVVAVSRAARESAHGERWVQADLGAADLHLPLAAAALSLSPIWLLPPALPALKAAGVGRIVAVSSTSRFTKAQSPEPQERAVAARLAEAEAATAAFCAAQDMAWTILRPTLIYAEGLDANVSRLARVIDRWGVFPVAGEGRGLRQPVHADDLAAACLQAIDALATHGRAYDLPGGETLSYRAMVVRIFQGLGRRPRIVTLSPGLWRLGLRAAGPLLPDVTAAMGARMDADLVFDAGPAARDLEWAPRPFRPRFRAATRDNTPRAR